MTAESLAGLDPRRQQAVEELTEMNRLRYPTASFVVGAGQDDPQAIHIVATVDVDDPDEVTDLVIERELALQIDEGIPVYVIPVQTPERAHATMRRVLDRPRRYAIPSITMHGGH